MDVVQLPISHKGNKYAIVFVDYLTKWPEVFLARDKSSLTIAKVSLTIAKVLVERIIPTHEVPSRLLSDGLLYSMNWTGLDWTGLDWTGLVD